MEEVVIIDAVRTPIGRYNGALRDVRPDDLGAIVLRALKERNPQVPIDEVEEVVFGNANGAGEDNRNVARMSTLLAGYPVQVAATTLNRLCGSGLDAVAYAARMIAVGEGEIVIAGGTESMTRAPYVMEKPGQSYMRGDQTLYDTTIGWRFVHPVMEETYGVDSMPETAENVAKTYSISRLAQDHFAYVSQMRAKEAMECGRLDEELVPVEIEDKKNGKYEVRTDEHPRPTSTMEKLNSLSPLFENGTVTAGNASGINDGAAAVLLMSRKKANELGLTPLASYIGAATAGVEPRIMGIGPVYATNKLLNRIGWTVNGLDLIELNEAFAAQALACIHELGLNQEVVNVNGGAIAYGHPLGASGARILTTLLYEMRRRGSRKGLATMCIGVGQGISVAVERID
ncbi:acetyl-CoA C-acyltransferase [Halalkalibacterium halodurans]|jgi:3-oxo-5,6-didehydrosuberyl-CoA/3-oxoadipyl-CoA thiolase|uniref:acetyl-CoA C-acyltransferase n=1 Tax=Halalkalibacterium halodurans (strain ATCC BAA-125 / DSM 18197 / FERM 7344 / JCM 9153 / C-125) TaxID=272558 RepID=Q9KGA7_HALH5|nr:acetyl-CoA C-acyltransferase [Halalkalibacterium halodurans]MED4081304.1 acetyl-CoA C-acyltransferase [Halalkalibacterium halodurans]MED4084019.1 acetyl-CoA C-acyltransferase [Halalkalibacterium halodurans]MED4105976.1 acetyl-CoA C-acyltransferase [Halalkalibacterium halodurans]MED4107350.1 acetyl-CoA C-acyltransferase [Halalkalibacterium halodurans]MED4125888.1 acetyl-CoA C-acyltransferase [Halalkalibacterium halodurans]